ncbi:MAG: hypothetical protein F6K35_29180 [Okeania sp. SIO2H7]|nr:hypothetical protein [Okeania sp. SIO2H7]
MGGVIIERSPQNPSRWNDHLTKSIPSLIPALIRAIALIPKRYSGKDGGSAFKSRD